MKRGLSEEDKIRYSRQMAVSSIGEEGQIKLRGSRVFIVGCGALGSMVAMQLAGAGVGVIGLADYDTIDISNLQRQFFFSAEEHGRFKTDILASRIMSLNPDVEVKVKREVITGRVAEEVFPDYDFIIDATDNPESKRMIGEKCRQLRKACCLGGVRDFEGQVITLLPEDPRFEDFFGEAENEGFLPCSLGGVTGPAAALCASVQSSETIKYLIGKGTLLSGKILFFDLFKDTFRIFSL